ncbi:hypothetical protein Tco_0632204, partial [Tanacetum coccineum]
TNAEAAAATNALAEAYMKVKPTDAATATHTPCKIDVSVILSVHYILLLFRTCEVS